MNNGVLVLWILAYSITGADLLLGLVTYLQNKRKDVAAFLLLLFNILLITLISFLYGIAVLPDDLFNLLLQNSLLLLYLTLPNLLYKMYKISFRIKYYFIFYMASVICVNLLFILKIELIPYFYMICWIPFLINGFVIYTKSKIDDYKMMDRGNPLYFYKSLKSAWNMTGIIAGLMGIFSIVLLVIPSDVNGNVYSSFFAVFYSFYCIPSLVYFIYYHLNEEEDAYNIFDNLSDRENEVAELIIAGKKYREIGDSLFISLSTVKKHANSIYRKTGSTNGTQLIQKNFNSKKS